MSSDNDNDSDKTKKDAPLKITKFDIKLCDLIKKDRPNIKNTSVVAYISALKQIRKFVNDTPLNVSITDINFLLNYDSIKKYIDSLSKITSKKNKLTAVLVGLSLDKDNNETLIKKYITLLKDLNEQYLTFLRQQSRTEAQKKNWMTLNQVKTVCATLKQEILDLDLQNQKIPLLRKDYNTLQYYVVLSTYLNIPIRNDYADMKILSINKYDKLPKKDTDENNYLVLCPNNKKQFRINVFKNRSKMGQQVITVPNNLSKIINIWLNFNKSGYYLTMTDQTTPLSPNGITKLFNRLFLKYADGKKISTSMLRHIIISDDLKDEPTIHEKDKKREETEHKFLHSGPINELYRKVS